METFAAQLFRMFKAMVILVEIRIFNNFYFNDIFISRFFSILNYILFYTHKQRCEVKFLIKILKFHQMFKTRFLKIFIEIFLNCSKVA